MMLTPRLRDALSCVLHALDGDAALGRPARGVMASELRKAIEVADQEGLQRQVGRWLARCFGETTHGDAGERTHRFLEEALELAQSAGATTEEAHALVEYVFRRPAGRKHQEAGQALITLAALCHAIGVDLHQEALAELERINDPEVMVRIRAKHDSRPVASPLPGAFAGEAMDDRGN